MPPLISPRTAPSLANAFRETLLSPDWAVQPFSGEADSLFGGAAYILKQNPTHYAPMPEGFTNSGYYRRFVVAAKQRNEEEPRFNDATIAYLIHWPTLLREALFSQPSRFPLLAHTVLRHMHEIVEHYDYVLATDIRYFWVAYSQLSEDRRINEPLNHGQPNETAEQRFDAHLTHLLENDAFLTTLTRSLDATFEPAVRKDLLEEHAYCPTHDHDETCPDCAPRLWLRKHTSVYDARKLQTERLQFRRKAFVKSFFDELPPNEWYEELRYALFLYSGNDGGYVLDHGRRWGKHILIHFPQLVQNAIELNRLTIFQHYMVTKYAPHNWTVAGVEAKKAFVAVFGDRVLAPQELLQRSVVQVGGTWHGEAPWLLLNAQKVARTLRGYCRKSEALLELRRKGLPAPTKPRPLDILAEDYIDPKGTAYTIQIAFRRRKGVPTILFTLPMDSDEFLPDEYLSAEYRRKRGFKLPRTGRIFWTLRAIGQFANLAPPGHPNERLFKWAEPFDRWALQMSSLTYQEFKKKLFDSRLDERRRAVKLGQRRHPSYFTEVEDVELREFCDKREPGVIREEEWAKLSLRHWRSRRAITHRIGELGFEYFAEFGWSAYATSGYCLMKNHRRREKWKLRLAKMRVV